MLSSILPPIFGTAVAIVISWALFAIFCSLLLEAWAQLKAERGRFMKKWLQTQLFDAPNGVNWAGLLYVHGSIDLLVRDSKKPLNAIAPRTFAETLVDLVANTHLVQMQQKDAPVAAKYSHPVLQGFYTATQVLLQSDVVSMMRQSLASAEMKAGEGEAAVYEYLVSDIARWYEAMQERLSLWYKKKSRRWLFIIGCLLGLFMNVDSIQLFSFYSKHPAAQEAVTSYYESRQVQLSQLADSLDKAIAQGGNNAALQTQLTATKAFARQMDSLSSANALPIGPKALRQSLHNEQGRFLWGAAFWKLLGVLISGFAASFGGPFWFDALRRFYSPAAKK